MKWFLFTVLLLSSCATEKVTSQPGKKIPNFKLLDQNAYARELFYDKQSKAVVLVWQSLACKEFCEHYPSFEALSQRLSQNNVSFYFINSASTDSWQSIKKEAHQNHWLLPILKDDTQYLARSLGISRCMESVVLDSSTRRMIFHGPSSFLPEVLEKLSRGENHVSEVESKGEPFTQNVPEIVSYTNEIVPIIKARCLSCHATGRMAPWSMKDHATIAGWAPMIKEVLLTKRMPPMWLAPGHPSLVTDLTLPPEEAQKILTWIDQGAKLIGKDHPLQPKETVSSWPLGKPDLVLPLKKRKIPATGEIDYVFTLVKNPLKEDKWLRAVDVRPGNRKVLHHIRSFLVSERVGEEIISSGVIPVDAENSDAIPMLNQQSRKALVFLYGKDLSEFLVGYSPGNRQLIFPNDSGRPLKKNQFMLIESHYLSTGKEESDQTELALYFHRTRPKKVYNIKEIKKNLLIQPHAPHHVVESELMVFNRPALVHQIMPHMHTRAKDIRITKTKVDGSTEVILSIPSYNYNWQHIYGFTKPLLMEAGSKLSGRVVYDNSGNNLFNPDPTQLVKFGMGTNNEMFYIQVFYTEK